MLRVETGWATPMDLWLDTAEVEVIVRAARQGVLTGVTTNPTILATAGRPPAEIIPALLKAQPGWLTVQVTATETTGMVAQGKRLRDLSRRIVVKIPMTPAGLEATDILSQKDIPVMVTAVVQPQQAWLAHLAGAAYVAPYLGRMLAAGLEGFQILEDMVAMVRGSHPPTQIIVASVKTLDQVVGCARAGVHGVTLPGSLFDQLHSHPLTTQGLAQFAEAGDQLAGL